MLTSIFSKCISKFIECCISRCQLHWEILFFNKVIKFWICRHISISPTFGLKCVFLGTNLPILFVILFTDHPVDGFPTNYYLWFHQVEVIFHTLYRVYVLCMRNKYLNNLYFSKSSILKEIFIPYLSKS